MMSMFYNVLKVNKIWNHDADGNLDALVIVLTDYKRKVLTIIWKMPVIRPRTSLGEHSET